MKLNEFLYEFTDNDSKYFIVNEKLNIIGNHNQYDSKYSECEVIKIHNNIKGIMAIEIKTENPLEQLNAYKLMEAPYMAEKLKEGNYDLFMEHLKQSEIEISNKVIELVREINDIKEKLWN